MDTYLDEFLEYFDKISDILHSILCLDGLVSIEKKWEKKSGKIVIKKDDIERNEEKFKKINKALNNFMEYCELTLKIVNNHSKQLTLQLKNEEKKKGNFLDRFLDKIDDVTFGMICIKSLDNGDEILDEWEEEESEMKVTKEDLTRNKENFDEVIDDLNHIILYCEKRLSLIEGFKEVGSYVTNEDNMVVSKNDTS